MISLGELCVDLAHGHEIFPSAKALAGHFADLQVIAKGCKGTAKIVERADCNVGFFTGGNGMTINQVWISDMDVGR